MKKTQLLENIINDFEYIQAVKTNHKNLIKKASNETWQFKSIQRFPDGTGVCEYGEREDKRHIGLKYIIRLENIRDKSLISVGRGCYKKIMGSSKKVSLPTFDEWKSNKKMLGNAETKYKSLLKKFNVFIKTELPELLNTAKKYEINFDIEKFSLEIKNPELIGFAVERVRILGIQVKQFEKEKKLELQKELIMQKMQGFSKEEEPRRSNKSKKIKKSCETEIVKKNVTKFMEDTKKRAQITAKIAIRNKKIKKNKEYSFEYITDLISQGKNYAEILRQLKKVGLSPQESKSRLNAAIKNSRK